MVGGVAVVVIVVAGVVIVGGVVVAGVVVDCGESSGVVGIDVVAVAAAVAVVVAVVAGQLCLADRDIRDAAAALLVAVVRHLALRRLLLPV